MKLTRAEASLLASGQSVFSVWGHVLHDGSPDVYVREQRLKGKRRHNWMIHKFSRARFLINGSLDDRYFTKRKEADGFVADILAGKHPGLIGDMIERDHQVDGLDECF